MTTIPVHAGVWYLTVIEGLSWRDQDYLTNKIVKCVKGEKVNGSFSVRVGETRYTFTEKNKADFLRMLHQLLANSIKSKIQPGAPTTLVPVPNSTVTSVDSTSFRTLMHARAIAAGMGEGASATPALVWKQALPSARRGGPRDPQLLLSNLRLTKKPAGTVILFDDVMTSGGHLIAAYRKLKESGCTPTAAIVVARATQEQQEKMLQWSVEDLVVEAEAPFWEF